MAERDALSPAGRERLWTGVRSHDPGASHGLELPREMCSGGDCEAPPGASREEAVIDTDVRRGAGSESHTARWPFLPGQWLRAEGLESDWPGS